MVIHSKNKDLVFPAVVLAVLGILLGLSVGCLPSTEIQVSSTPTITPATLMRITQHTNTPTTTPIPTLAPDEAYDQLFELLNNDTSCRLPCWLGITPGKSTLDDLQTQMTLLSNITVESTFGFPAGSWLLGEFTIQYTDTTSMILIRSSFLVPQNEDKIKVTGIDLDAHKLADAPDRDLFGYPAFNELLESYTIFGVLSFFGIPDQVYLGASLRGDTSVTPGWGDYFLIDLWYPETGVFMRYRIPAENAGENYRFCPTKAWISGTLIEPNLGDDYQDVLLSLGDEYTNFFPPSEKVKIPEQVLGISIDEFYGLFSLPTDYCLETPKVLWWPERFSTETPAP